MNLLLIILFLTAVSFLPQIFPKSTKLVIIFSVLIVISFYFFLSKNFFYPETFYPTTKIQTYIPLGNYYNFIVNSIKKKKKLYIHIDYDKFPLLKQSDIYKNYGKYAVKDKNYLPLFDTSLYKGKIYLYFGITPIFLFYIPFHLVTGLYLTDKLLVFVLSSFSFLLLLFLLKLILSSYCRCRFNTSINSYFSVSVFLVGFCCWLPFILIRSSIYEVAIITAVFLLLCSFVLLYFYLNHSPVHPFTYSPHKVFSLQIFQSSNVLIFFLGLFLSLAVGARPHYVLFIVLFFMTICCINYYNTKNTKYVLQQAIIFLIPCVAVGSIIALYNYLRFDSVFEFGWKYQLSELNLYAAKLSVGDSILALKYNLFQFPEINKETVFSLTRARGHIFGNEFVTGVIWSFPLMFLLVFVPKLLSETFKENKNLFCISILMIAVICINIFITGFIGGMVNRYFVEYMPFIVILSLLMFDYIHGKLSTKFLKKIAEIFFVLIFIYSVFVNISLLFSNNNATFYEEIGQNIYSKTINFLYNKNIVDETKDWL